MKPSEEIRNLFLIQSSEDKSFLGGIPYTENIEREIKNYEKFILGKIIERRRLNLGKTFYRDDELWGYCSFTIMNNSNSTNYEKEFIELNGKLNYIHFRKLVVHPRHRNKGIGDYLVKYRLNLSKSLEKKSVCDVKEKNEKIINLLEKNGFEKSFEWKTKKGSLMLRLIHD